MIIEVLRLSHRIRRDPRISTHCALVARTFGAEKVYYSGNKDSSLEKSINNVVERWGGVFSIEYVKNPVNLIKEKKKQGFIVVHLTMFGEEREVKVDKILVIIGSERVPISFYKLADFNIAIKNQPHSEVSSLAIFMDNYKINKKFTNAKQKIIPQKNGKKIVKL